MPSLSEGLCFTQYQVLRKNDHTSSEAFNETVEEATQPLDPIKGMSSSLHMAPKNSWIFTTKLHFQHLPHLEYPRPSLRKASLPLFENESVKSGTATQKSLELNGRPTYCRDLVKGLDATNSHEIW